MKVKLEDDGKQKHQSVSASLPDLWVDPCGYGSTEMEALQDLAGKLDAEISKIDKIRQEVISRACSMPPHPVTKP